MKQLLTSPNEELFTARIFAELGEKIDITAIEPVNKGWSNDKKYLIRTSKGEKLLIRISDKNDYEGKKYLFEKLKEVATLGVNTPIPMDAGLCNSAKSAYILLSWVEGEDAKSVLPQLKRAQQYSLGVKTGVLVQKLHNLPAPKDAEAMGVRYRREMQKKINYYNNNPVKSPEGDTLVRYLLDNQELLDSRPNTFMHGDCNITNIIVTPDSEIGLIDFWCDYGDPWWEFDPASWGEEPIAPFITGIYNGYFNGKPPATFFKMQSFYLAFNALEALCAYLSEGDDVGKNHAVNVMRWFDDMRNPIPSWYNRGFST